MCLRGPVLGSVGGPPGGPGRGENDQSRKLLLGGGRGRGNGEHLFFGPKYTSSLDRTLQPLLEI